MASLNFHAAFKGRYTRALIAFCAVLAVVSLTRGVANALRPGQSQDFAMVATWSLVWLFGDNPYHLAADAVANYPPHAVVFLTPVAETDCFVVGHQPQMVGVPGCSALARTENESSSSPTASAIAVPVGVDGRKLRVLPSTHQS